VFILRAARFSLFYRLLFADSGVTQDSCIAQRMLECLALNKNQLNIKTENLTTRSIENAVLPGGKVFVDSSVIDHQHRQSESQYS